MREPGGSASPVRWCAGNLAPRRTQQCVKAAQPQNTKIAHRTEEQGLTLWDSAAGWFRSISDIAGSVAVSSAASVQPSSLRRLFLLLFLGSRSAVPAVTVVTCFLLIAV